MSTPGTVVEGALRTNRDGTLNETEVSAMSEMSEAAIDVSCIVKPPTRLGAVDAAYGHDKL